MYSLYSRDIKDEITTRDRDRDLLLTQHEGRADMSIVVEAIGLPQLWDLALDNGAKCIEGLRNLVATGDHVPTPCHAGMPPV